MLLVAQVVLNLFVALLPPLSTYLGKLTVDQLGQAVQNPAARPLAVWFVLAGMGVMLLSFLGYASVYLVERYLTENFTIKMDELINTKTQRIPLTFFDRPQTYDQLQRARSNFGDRGVQVASAAIRIGASVLTLLSYLGLLAIVHKAVPLALIPVFAISLYMNLRMGSQRFELTTALTSAQRQVFYLSQLLMGVDMAKELRIFDMGHYLSHKWRKLTLGVRNSRLHLEWFQTLYRQGVNLLTFATSVTVTLWLLFRLLDGRVSLGTYISLSMAIGAAVNLMPQIASNITQLYEHALFTGHLLTFLALPEEEHAGDKPFPSPLRHGLTVEGLEFRYEGAETSTLRGISFHVEAGKTVAIVGENGAGKSTLVKCLLGLYPATGGRILYDGVDITAIDQKALRSRVTAVFQDFARMALTLRENVGLGNVERIDADDHLAAAVRRSGAEGIIRRARQGWDTRLGRMWENGMELSLGEWQRVAIARALVRDADLFVLDEPTASIDPKAEAALFKQLAEVTAAQTTLVISHRLGMARMADYILVLKDGLLVEEGTHDQLISQDGEYARMFRLQAQWYV